MKKYTPIIIGLVVITALVALALTVLNKSWWARRIDKRWVVSEVTPAAADAPAGFDKPTFTRVAFDDARASMYGLGELMRLYFSGGGATWVRK